MADEAKEKKLIIDEDWKAQAQKEKQQLKEEVEKASSRKERSDLPEADFAGLVSMLATQAFYALGLIRTEEDKDKQIEPDWAMARYNIDLLAMLEDKCKGNLQPEEKAMLDATLSQLRIAFVELSK
ncbi:MAG: DUF1844 domain-containing protein [Planctomycetes bacterium]|nr:DUF1844 domain-containing protein [Planctomycetota bacterium]